MFIKTANWLIKLGVVCPYGLYFRVRISVFGKQEWGGRRENYFNEGFVMDRILNFFFLVLK